MLSDLNAVGLLTGSALQDMDVTGSVKIHLPTYAYSSFPTIDPCHRRALVGEALKESFVGR